MTIEANTTAMAKIGEVTPSSRPVAVARPVTRAE
jgi:hypothetical protein